MLSTGRTVSRIALFGRALHPAPAVGVARAATGPQATRTAPRHASTVAPRWGGIAATRAVRSEPQRPSRSSVPGYIPDTDDATRVDNYFEERLVGEDDALTAAQDASAEHGLPAIAVSPALGKMLNLMVRMSGASSVLEIGTLGGYSTIWLARAVEGKDDAHVVTCEVDPHHAEVARGNLDHAGVGDMVDLRVGSAADSMRALVAEGRTFDFIFIDADKPSNPEYLRQAMKLSRPGTTIVLDNVVRGGKVADPSSDDPSVLGTQEFTDMVAAELWLSATAVQTVGTKGWDGFVLAVVQ